jgi:hypothetical protein
MEHEDLKYQLSPASYAKGKMALHIPSKDGWMSLAACILTQQVAPNCRFSNREHSYIVSPCQAERFEKAIAAEKVRREEMERRS